MPPPKPGKRFVTTEIEEDLAFRFRRACYAQDRSVSGGIRRLIREYLGEAPEPLNGVEPATNGLERSTTDTDSGRDRLAPA
jgi:hypothetical protein